MKSCNAAIGRHDAGTPSSMQGDARRDRLLIALVLTGGLLLRLWLVPHRWINPDEGAHLMDGRLALDGLVPMVDFSSRQVLYVFALSRLLALFGTDYLAVRYVVAVVATATAGTVYLIARRLFDRSVALLAVLLYTFLPLAVIWSATVHTEPFTALASSLAVYCVVRHAEAENDHAWLFAAGMLLSLGYYLRESSLAVLVATVLFLAIGPVRPGTRVGRRIGVLAAGFLLPCLLVGMWYSRYLSLEAYWASPLNPLHIVIKNLKAVAQPSHPASAGAITSPTQATPWLNLAEQPWTVTTRYVRHVLSLNLTLLIAAAISAWPLTGTQKPAEGEPTRSRLRLVPYIWIGCLSLIYGYWTVRRGFFPQYAEEFLPPLAILFAYGTLHAFVSWRPATRVLPLGGGLALYSAGLFAFPKLAPQATYPKLLYVIVPAVLLAVWHVFGSGRWRRWLLVAAGATMLTVGLDWLGPTGLLPRAVLQVLKAGAPVAVLALIYLAARRPGLRQPSFAAFAACVAIVASLGYSAVRAGEAIDYKYESLWSPQTVREVADYLRANTPSPARVMSGAVIWELQANRRPFANVSHPLSFKFEIEPPEIERIQRALASAPPEVVVMDGYTEMTYGRILPDLNNWLASHYRFAETVGGSEYPVRLYLQRPGTVGQ